MPMHKFPVISGKELIKALGKAGFEVVSQRGSHVKMKKSGDDFSRIAIIPLKDVIRTGTFKSILRQARMELEELATYL